ncbi:unnamed protein product [Prorocentrum cordatum]|uniref:Kinesin motor domain-containing protein n=1 Tax=Prorocentrum cordatum TaxID=2364126 RepID=A0ABN9TQT9_9DINO|nr:unnamed protein product [Polarella glacialis]
MATPQRRHRPPLPDGTAAPPHCQAGHDEGGGRRAGPPLMSVAVRVKPSPGAAPEDVAVWAEPPECGGARQRKICCHRGYMLEEYEFSRVFGPADDNRALFHELQGPALTASVFGGVNETLFAYGQTGSGKTHTIFGSAEEPGLLELFVQASFQEAGASPGSTIHACCYEVLGDTLTDLVNPQRLIEQGDLISEDVVSDEIFVKTQLCRYQIVRVARVETCLDLLGEARANRTEGVSSCNPSSSRSHAVVHLFVQNPAGGLPRSPAGHQDPEGVTQSTIGALTLVDLAGTEKEHENPSVQGKKSARLLNTSLSSLNRLLRKLQTGSLDESERRQSVLNKCLWEYLRPGCGIAMVFCVSPLARHRSITLSTLAMATDSKLIHNQRKSHYIQIPAQSQLSGARPTVQSTPSQSPRSARSSLHSPQAASSGSRGTPRITSVRAASTGASAATGRVPEFGAPTRSSIASSRLCTTKHEADELRSAKDLEALAGFDLSCPQAIRDLALQNTTLRRKLHRVRAKSAERIERAERDREQLGADLAMTQQECESLRALFIRQQQQQIAFWTGPFMSMIAPRDAAAAPYDEPAPRQRLSQGAADAGHCPTIVWSPKGSRGEGSPPRASAHTPPALAPAACGSGAVPPAAPAAAASARAPPEGSGPAFGAGATPPVVTPPAAGGGGSSCLDSLRLERDYWRSVASDLKREMHGEAPKCGDRNSQEGSHRPCAAKAPGLWDCGGSSTSQTVHESVGDPSRTAWSDTGSELSSRSLAAEA